MHNFLSPVPSDWWGQNVYKLTEAEFYALYDAVAADGSDWAYALLDNFNNRLGNEYYCLASDIDPLELEWLEDHEFYFNYFPYLQSQFPVHGG